MPTMDAKNLAAGQPFSLTQALSVFRPGMGVDASMQLQDQLEEERKKLKRGQPSDPAAYGGILSSVGIFGGLR